MKYKQAIKKLIAIGYSEKPGKGSHRIFIKGKNKILLPAHGEELSNGRTKAVERAIR